MNMTTKWVSIVFSVLIFILSGTAIVAAQAETCSTIAADALTELGNNCGDLGRNEVCYGNILVDRDFRVEQPETAFSSPADVAELDALESLRTAAFNAERNEWGIAAMRVQADLVETLPGQAALFLMLGDVDVTDDSANREGINPMQAFYFRGGIGRPDCADAPSTLAIESQDDLTIELTINGLEVRLGSLITLTSSDPESMVITLHEGILLLVEPGLLVQRGQSVDITLDENGEYVSAAPPRTATSAELALVKPVTQAINALEGTTTVNVPEEDAEEVVEEDTTASSRELTYTVQPGDNMFRIALNNNTCVSAIARANNIPASQVRSIPVGLELVIPDGSTCGAFVNDVPVNGPIPPPNTTSSTRTTETTETADTSDTTDDTDTTRTTTDDTTTTTDDTRSTGVVGTTDDTITTTDDTSIDSMTTDNDLSTGSSGSITIVPQDDPPR